MYKGKNKCKLWTFGDDDLSKQVHLLQQCIPLVWGFPDGSVLKNLPANAGDARDKIDVSLQSLSGEDPLEQEMATHSSILACKIPWAEEPGKLCPWNCKELNMTEHTTHCYLSIYLLFGQAALGTLN